MQWSEVHWLASSIELCKVCRVHCRADSSLLACQQHQALERKHANPFLVQGGRIAYGPRDPGPHTLAGHEHGQYKSSTSARAVQEQHAITWPGAPLPLAYTPLSLPITAGCSAEASVAGVTLLLVPGHSVGRQSTSGARPAWALQQQLTTRLQLMQTRHTTWLRAAHAVPLYPFRMPTSHSPAHRLHGCTCRCICLCPTTTLLPFLLPLAPEWFRRT